MAKKGGAAVASMSGPGRCWVNAARVVSDSENSAVMGSMNLLLTAGSSSNNSSSDGPTRNSALDGSCRFARMLEKDPSFLSVEGGANVDGGANDACTAGSLSTTKPPS